MASRSELDFVKLAQKAKERSDEQAARAFYTKAARYCAYVPATVAYAEGMIKLVRDRDDAKKIPDEAETDRQFTKQFVALASGYKSRR